MDDNNKQKDTQHYDEFENREVNWLVVIPILLVMTAAVLYVFFL